MKKITFRVRGLTPLLTHNPASMVAGPKKPTKGKDIPTPEVEAERGCYRDEEGRFCIPSIGFRNALLVASKQFKGKGRKSLFDTLAHIMTERELTPILDAKGKPAKSYVIDTRRAMVQRNGVMRSRPKFEDWTALVELIYDETMFGEHGENADPVLRAVLIDAGNRIGVGDYRPARWGWFGRFTVEN